MNTLSDVEEVILGLSQVECGRLIEWLEVLQRNRLRISESAVKYRAAPQAPKRIAYRRVAALEEYVIVAQEGIEVAIHRRAENWLPSILDNCDAVLELRSIGLALPLGRIYEGETVEL